MSWNMGASTSWNLQGLSRPVQGLFYLALLIFQSINIRHHQIQYQGLTLLVLELQKFLFLLPSATASFPTMYISYKNIRISLLKIESHYCECYFDKCEPWANNQNTVTPRHNISSRYNFRKVNKTWLRSVYSNSTTNGSDDGKLHLEYVSGLRPSPSVPNKTSVSETVLWSSGKRVGPIERAIPYQA